MVLYTLVCPESGWKSKPTKSREALVQMRTRIEAAGDCPHTHTITEEDAHGR